MMKISDQNSVNNHLSGNEFLDIWKQKQNKKLNWNKKYSPSE